MFFCTWTAITPATRPEEAVFSVMYGMCAFIKNETKWLQLHGLLLGPCFCSVGISVSGPVQY